MVPAMTMTIESAKVDSYLRFGVERVYVMSHHEGRLVSTAPCIIYLLKEMVTPSLIR